jgi:hypothetical protein
VYLDDLVRRDKIELHFYRENMIIGREASASDHIRSYLAAMHTVCVDGKPGQAEFFAWAEHYADHLDPTTDFRIAVLDEA